MYLNIIILGLAGAGKTAAAAALTRWSAKHMKHPTAVINMDPGARHLPYRPAFDVRSIVTVERLMKKYALGPNGAMLRSMDIMYKNRAKIATSINCLDADIKIIDTPGQMEIFVFHDACNMLAMLKRPSAAVFLMPADVAMAPPDIAIAQLIAAAVRFRIGIPLTNVISKADRLSKTERKRVAGMLSEPAKLLEDIRKERGMKAGLAAEIAGACESVFKHQRGMMISARTGAGIGELYLATHELLCSCGDMS